MDWFERQLLVELGALLFAGFLLRGDVLRGAWWSVVVAMGLVALLAFRLVRIVGRHSRLRVSEPGYLRESLQLELLLLCTVYLLIQFTGAQASPLYPLLFLLLAAAGGFDRRWLNAAILTFAAAVLEVFLFLASDRAMTGTLAAHMAAIACFPSMWAIFTKSWLAGVRRKMAAELAEDRRIAEMEADAYRTSGFLQSNTKALPAEKRLEQRQRSSAKELGIGVGNLLEAAQAVLHPQTVALFLLSTDDKVVTLKDARSESDLLVCEPISAAEGVIGAVLKNQGTVFLSHVRDSGPQLTYYRAKVPVKAFLGVPVMEDGHNRGVLLADRRDDIPFRGDDEKLMLVLAREVWRMFETERLLSDMDKESYLTNLFYESSKNLNRAVNQQEVIDEVLTSVRHIFEGVDFAAMVVKEGEKGPLVLRGINAVPEFDSFWEKFRFTELQGRTHLCTLSIQNGSPLPLVGFHKMSSDPGAVFGKKTPLTGLESLKVFPLKVAASEKGKSVPGKQNVLGVLVVGGKRHDLFPEAAAKALPMIGMLEALANMAATSIQSAQRYELLERQATTDGLTNLHNHRRFQEMMNEAAADALRYHRPLSMILADVDHFKKINDVYGHPVGDEVLKRVARVLTQLARESDRVCRYGGEEFAVIMSQTDVEGSQILAERFREEIKQQKFTVDGKEFSVTISFGICTLPDHARHKQELIDRADQALYHAKRNGRDRTVHFADIARATAQGSAS